MMAARMAIALGMALGAWAVLAKPAPAPAAPSPQDIVAIRQAGMAMSATTLGTLKAAGAGGAPLKPMSFAAGGLARWAAALPALFPPSTRAVPGRAKPEIWTDRAGFSTKAATFATAAAALAAAAKAEDRDAYSAALASTGAACKGCHDSFQVPPPPAKAG